MNEETNYRQFWRNTVIAIVACIVVVWIPVCLAVVRIVKFFSGDTCL